MKVNSSDSQVINSKNEAFGRSMGTSSKQASFVEALKTTEAEKRREACQTILSQIDDLSEELKKGPTPAGVKKYRKLIAAFVKEAMSQSSELHEDTHWDREGNRKNYILVKQINQSVDELMDTVISQEKKQIDLVARLDQIRGLLMDLYM